MVHSLSNILPLFVHNNESDLTIEEEEKRKDITDGERQHWPRARRRSKAGLGDNHEQQLQHPEMRRSKSKKERVWIKRDNE
jgi:hypothetical protein